MTWVYELAFYMDGYLFFIFFFLRPPSLSLVAMTDGGDGCISCKMANISLGHTCHHCSWKGKKDIGGV